MTPSERELLDAAVAVVQQDLDVTGIGRRATLVSMGEGRLGAGVDDGGSAGHDQPVSGETLEVAVWTVAAAVQDTLAAVHWIVWPVCRAHGVGVHLHPLGGRGVPIADDLPWPLPAPGWWCKGGGGHELAAVGELQS